MPVVKDKSTILVDNYHPSLWSSSKCYPCCGASIRCTSRSSNGCCPITWSPSSFQHMGINFSSHFHSSSNSTPSPSAHSNGAPETVKLQASIDSSSAAVKQPPSPSSPHTPAVLSSGMSPLFYSRIKLHIQLDLSKPKVTSSSYQTFWNANLKDSTFETVVWLEPFVMYSKKCYYIRVKISTLIISKCTWIFHRAGGLLCGQIG